MSAALDGSEVAMRAVFDACDTSGTGAVSVSELISLARDVLGAADGSPSSGSGLDGERDAIVTALESVLGQASLKDPNRRITFDEFKLIFSSSLMGIIILDEIFIVH